MNADEVSQGLLDNSVCASIPLKLTVIRTFPERHTKDVFSFIGVVVICNEYVPIFLKVAFPLWEILREMHLLALLHFTTAQ